MFIMIDLECDDFLNIHQAEEDKARLQGLIANIESEVKATDTVSTRSPDVDWLGDTKVNIVKKVSILFHRLYLFYRFRILIH